MLSLFRFPKPRIMYRFVHPSRIATHVATSLSVYYTLLQHVLHRGICIMEDRRWLLFLPQLPATPSSLRVAVWRRMRSIGSVALQHGVWVLPQHTDHERFLRGLLDDIRLQGGQGLLLTAQALAPTQQMDVMTLFQGERDREYAEFCERCAAFCAEIVKETARQKFTFAELEENDDDLKKLTAWRHKIQARDFFPGLRAAEADATLDQCTTAFHAFALAVYQHEGITGTGDGDAAAIDAQ